MQNPVILSANSAKSLVQNDVSITTRELAQQLGTRPNVITENAKKCLPNKKIENGKPTYWSKAEVTVLLEFIKSNKIGAGVNLSNDLIGTSTDLTPSLRMIQAMEMFQKAANEELARLRAENVELGSFKFNTEKGLQMASWSKLRRKIYETICGKTSRKLAVRRTTTGARGISSGNL